MEAADSSYMLASTYPTTWCHNPEDNSLQNQCDENLKSDGKDVSMLI
jgi:hypothetical protein